MCCINFKKRQKKGEQYFYCSLKNEKINFDDCKSCLTKRYKSVKTKTKLVAKKPLKKVSKKQAKIERNRFSIFTDDLTISIESGLPKDDLHECLGGKNRLNSIKYGLVVPLTRVEHQNVSTVLKWQLKAQEEFVKKYGYDKFMEIFKMDYCEKQKKSKQ